jgi:hypothetical protein
MKWFAAFCAGALITAAAHPSPALASQGGEERGLRFDSAGVLDLAQRSLHLDAGVRVEIGALSDDDAQRIFAAPAIGDDPLPLAVSTDVFGCHTPSAACAHAGERKLLATAGGNVVRDGARLTIRGGNGTTAAFVDWNQASTKNSEGDAETHWYLGTLPGSGYDRVEVEFGHDAPGSFLVNRKNGKVAFVHNAADLAAPSPDGRLLVTWNALNPPLSLRVAALDADGPRPVLQCQAPEGKAPLTPVFKGWHADAQFDFVVEIGAGKSMARLAASASQREGHWHVDASDAARAGAIGLVCRSS